MDECAKDRKEVKEVNQVNGVREVKELHKVLSGYFAEGIVEAGGMV